MWGILTAIVSGTLMSVQGVFNTEMTKQTSLWLSSAFVQLTARGSSALRPGFLPTGRM